MKNILCLGDIISTNGCDFIRKKLPSFKRDNNIDIVIANGENSADRNGISPQSADHLFDSGVDIITTGNHVFKRKDVYDYLERNDCVIRPANYPKGTVGNGYYLYDGGSFSLLVINLLGVAFLEPLRCPFEVADEIIAKSDTKNIIIDFHAESTGEKKALAHYLDGRISLLYGTHTHVQTADEQILPKGTAYITDIGMTGAINSILGIVPECIITRYKNRMPTIFEVDTGKTQIDGIFVSLNEKTGKCSEIKRINIS